MAKYMNIILLMIAWMSIHASGNTYYNLTETYSGSEFFGKWIFETFDDPTHGTVDYSPISSNLAYLTSKNSIILKVDNESLALTGRGRKSIRITSKNQYNEGLFVFDTTHIPYGCATLPSFWLFGPSWPVNGEIDVLEQVHNNNFTLNVLHTSDQCDFTNYNTGTSNLFSGHWETGSDGNTLAKNCYVSAPNQYSNQGCGIAANDGTFGQKWNMNNGGITILLIDRNDGIKIWTFSRNNIPSIINDSTVIIPVDIHNHFDLPISYFPFGAHCPASTFNDLSVVINIDLCGDWAGNTDVWMQSCQSTTEYAACDQFVRNEPGEFGNAYWDINYLKVFQLTTVTTANPTTADPTKLPSKSPTNNPTDIEYIILMTYTDIQYIILSFIMIIIIIYILFKSCFKLYISSKTKYYGIKKNIKIMAITQMISFLLCYLFWIIDIFLKHEIIFNILQYFMFIIGWILFYLFMV
eukprot:32320_1